MLGVLLEMELAALPGDAGAACGEGGAEAGVIVGDEAGDAAGSVTRLPEIDALRERFRLAANYHELPRFELGEDDLLNRS